MADEAPEPRSRTDHLCFEKLQPQWQRQSSALCPLLIGIEDLNTMSTRAAPYTHRTFT